MLPFPDEEKRKAEIQQELGSLFDLADRIYDFWLTGSKDQWHDESKLPFLVRQVAAIIDVQLIRKFRSIVEECRRGEARSASIIARSLFETQLALNFVLKPRIAVIVRKHPKKPGGFQALAPSPNNPATKKDYLSRALRAALYFSQIVPQSNKGLNRITADSMRLAKKTEKLQKNEGKAAEDAAYKNLPPEWVWIQKDTGNYSGLSIGDLAKVMRKSLRGWQQSPYHFQSTDTHATNYMKYVIVDEQNGTVRPRLIASNREIVEVMIEGLCVFLQSIKDQHRFMFRNNELGQTLHALSIDYVQTMRTFTRP